MNLQKPLSAKCTPISHPIRRGHPETLTAMAGDQRLDSAVGRLEALCSRFEETLKCVDPSAGGTIATETASGKHVSNPTAGADGGATSLDDIDESAQQALKLSSFLGEGVHKATTHLAEVVKAHAIGAKLISQNGKPLDDGAREAFLRPIGERIAVCTTDAERAAPADKPYLKAIEEAAQAMTWIAYAGPESGMEKPGKHTEEGKNSAEFWLNRLLMGKGEGKGNNDPTCQWCEAMKGLTQRIQAFVKLHHPNGLNWNAAAQPLKESQADSAFSSLATQHAACEDGGSLSNAQKDKQPSTKSSNAGDDAPQANATEALPKRGSLERAGTLHVVEGVRNEHVSIDVASHSQSVLIARCQQTTVEVRGMSQALLCEMKDALTLCSAFLVAGEGERERGDGGPV